MLPKCSACPTDFPTMTWLNYPSSQQDKCNHEYCCIWTFCCLAVSLTHSPLSLLKLKTVHNLSKITWTEFICYMFQPSLVIFKQLFTFWNWHIALSLFTLKCVCLRTKLSLRSAFFSFCGVRVCAHFICMFSLFGRNGESFVLKQTHFSVNCDTQLHGNILTYDLAQCDSFKMWTVVWRWPSRAETCSNWCFYCYFKLWPVLSWIKDGGEWVSDTVVNEWIRGESQQSMHCESPPPLFSPQQSYTSNEGGRLVNRLLSQATKFKADEI
jgi:hypothetical protein